MRKREQIRTRRSKTSVSSMDAYNHSLLCSENCLLFKKKSLFDHVGNLGEIALTSAENASRVLMKISLVSRFSLQSPCLAAAARKPVPYITRGPAPLPA